MGLLWPLKNFEWVNSTLLQDMDYSIWENKIFFFFWWEEDWAKSKDTPELSLGLHSGITSGAWRTMSHIGAGSVLCKANTLPTPYLLYYLPHKSSLKLNLFLFILLDMCMLNKKIILRFYFVFVSLLCPSPRSFFFLFPHFIKSTSLLLFSIFSRLVSKVLTVHGKLTAWSLLNISNTQPVISCRLFFCCLQRNINTALISGRFLLSEFLLLYLSYNLPGGEVIKF